MTDDIMAPFGLLGIPDFRRDASEAVLARQRDHGVSEPWFCERDDVIGN
ncbi:MAG: hypothetical protein M3373_03520 [Gemmatimonadota bacterium]|nr:hypothetical protein [Gemmatimonadota bacterium]